MILMSAPRLLWSGISRANRELIFLALDLAVPPLSLLGFLVIGIFAISVLGAIFGASSAALVISTASLIGFIVPVLISWLKYGREVLPIRSVLAIPAYIFDKLPIYRNALARNAVAQWTRTDRNNSTDTHLMSDK
jgi:hypothetical protein